MFFNGSKGLRYPSSASYCWWKKSCDHQLRLVVGIPLFTVPPSQVVQNSFHQPYLWDCLWDLRGFCVVQSYCCHNGSHEPSLTEGKKSIETQRDMLKQPKWIQINPNRPNQVSPMMKSWWTTQPSITSSWYSKCPESLAQNGLQFHLPRWVLGTTGLHISCGYEEVKHEESNSLYTGTMWHSQNKSKRYACSTIYTYMCDFMLHISRNNLMQSASTAGKTVIHHVYV